MEPFWNFLLEASIGTALVWIIYYCLLRKLTFFGWNRFYLLAGTFLSLMIPLLNIQLGWENPVPVRDFIFSVNPREIVTSESNAILSESIFQVALYLYFSIAVLRLLVFGAGTIMIFRKINHADIQLIDGVKIYTRPDFKPASFFNKILMPEFNGDSSTHHQILQHELEHVRQGHSWDLLFIHFVKSLLWINPFAYLTERALREVHEYQADKKVVQKSGVQAYCRLLVDNLTKQTPNPLFHSFNQFQIKNRIVMMNKRKSTHVERWKYFIGMPLLIMMLAIISWNMAEPKEKLIIKNQKEITKKFDNQEGTEKKIVTAHRYLGKFPWENSTEGGC